ncbi:MAG: hypothetical protein QF797_02375 [Alphaproteobacteria bacterium]|jgi:hypothetical protein|nr:hypothetical protein [Rhodospirillaceae bacterium]MDP6404032.1 hypothetical protein [Alphaproteobacteria bacterium]MDP6620862.1 hypothetical protein [Alphaproteobacteria bacterium]|tara:strand:- start:1047 stop:1397 length:351 start_codon:yes stop_codon:yes gene_type:complete
MSAQDTVSDRIFARLPDEVRQSFSDSQRSALVAAMGEALPGRHSINLRLSIPLLVTRIFLTVIADVERRGSGRRSAERGRHPVATLGNIAFLVLVVVTLYALALLATLIYGSVIEF